MTPGDRSASTRPAPTPSIAGSDSPTPAGSFALNSASMGAAGTAESRQGAGMLPTRTFAAMWLIGHGCTLVFVLGMVKVMGNG